MKVILAAVMSLDGRTTRGDEPGATWASTEDQTYFHALLAASPIIIMGSNTYRTAKPHLKLSPHIRRMVMTHEPERYVEDAVPSQLEFTRESPEGLISRLEQEKYEQVLLVSGEKLTTAFFSVRLVHEIWVTVEPVLFGKGKGITGELSDELRLELISTEQLNPKGTLLLKYKVLAK